jgi:hypothetical protein
MIFSLTSGVNPETQGARKRWEKKMYRDFYNQQSGDKDHFMGLGISAGHNTQDSAIEDARIEAAGQLAETIHNWVKVAGSLVQHYSKNNKNKELIEQYHSVVLSFSLIALKNIEFQEYGHLCSKKKYFTAMVASARFDDYCSRAMNEVGVPDNRILMEMLWDADSIYRKMATHETP